ncbi:type VI secretion system-associated protein TagF [Paraburkholderia sp. DHOC27]|nr:type VI secretion system-associated protein TagF [Paraburkholderia sp. DHOC27]
MSEPVVPTPEQAEAAAPRVAGWYGKLPSLGDFVTRRLPDEFVQPWDAWLCARLLDVQQALGERWLSMYLSCPVWRFFAMPGALGEAQRECWTGVLMASVDRVGRHFPLTIATALPAAPATSAEIDIVWQWLSDIEGVALAALDFEHTVSQLDQALATLPLILSSEFVMRDVQDSQAVKSEPWVVTCDGSFAEQLARSLASEWQTPAQGMSLWSAAFNESSDLPGDAEAHDTGADADKASSARVFRVWAASGLPDDALFTAMLANQTP